MTSPVRVQSLITRSIESRAAFAIAPVKPVQSRLGAAEHSSDRLVNFVGDRSRQLTKRRHAVGVRQLHLRLT